MPGGMKKMAAAIASAAGKQVGGKA
jgi:hypothetical protein